MNKIMFILTILSGIFLPLTLVTGYFGMNTGGLPLTEDPHGTLKVTVGLLLFEVPFIVWIWRMIKEK
jgi:magnesium transporter